MIDRPSEELASFAARLELVDIPDAVVRRAEDLLLDWFASALAVKGARAVESIERFARDMGPATGPSEVLISRRSTSPPARGLTPRLPRNAKPKQSLTALAMSRGWRAMR